MEAKANESIQLKIRELNQFIELIEKSEKEGKEEITCTCGGIMRFARSGTNNHIHAYCKSCGKMLVQ